MQQCGEPDREGGPVDIPAERDADREDRRVRRRAGKIGQFLGLRRGSGGMATSLPWTDAVIGAAGLSRPSVAARRARSC